MKKVKQTKVFSIKQATAMTKNLEEKYGQAVSIQCECTSYVDSGPKYFIYIANVFNAYANTWERVQDLYQKYIEETNE